MGDPSVGNALDSLVNAASQSDHWDALGTHALGNAAIQTDLAGAEDTPLINHLKALTGTGDLDSLRSDQVQSI